METPAPFSLDTALHRWRAHISQVPGITPDRLEELQSHLRDSLDRLKSAGLADDEAWIIAQKRVGHSETLGTEFTKMEELVAGAQPESSDAARNRSAIAIGAGFAVAVLVLNAVVHYGLRNNVAWPVVLLGTLLGGCVTGVIANRFPIRHAFRAALILTVTAISLLFLNGGPFTFPGDPDYDPMDVSVFEQLWGIIWPSLVLAATMCIGAALVEGQRSATSRAYIRKITRFIQDRWSLSGSTARIQP